MRRSGIELFDCHPAVNRLLSLRRARDYFQCEAERIQSGGAPLIASHTPELFREFANMANRQMAELAVRIWLDGEPIILLVENF